MKSFQYVVTNSPGIFVLVTMIGIVWLICRDIAAEKKPRASRGRRG